MNNNKSIVTGKVRISYEHLLKPYANQAGAEEKYSATLLIPKTDIATKAAIDAAIREAIEAGVAGRWNGVRPPQPPIPIHDGDGLRQSGEPYGPECKGCWVMTASSKQPQDIVDTNLQIILDAPQIYSGMYARISINFFAYNSAGKKGIGCGLGPVQKLADGEPLGGHVSAAEAFGSEPRVSTPNIPPYPQIPATPQGYPQYAPQAPAYPYAPAVDPITGRPIAG